MTTKRVSYAFDDDVLRVLYAFPGSTVITDPPTSTTPSPDIGDAPVGAGDDAGSTSATPGNNRVRNCVMDKRSTNVFAYDDWPDEIVTEIGAEPWLRPFLELGDTSLVPARRRFELAQSAAIEQLRRLEVPIQRRYRRGRLLTTSYDLSPLTDEDTP